LALRAVGSDQASAHRIGVRVGPTLPAAYALCGLFAALPFLQLGDQWQFWLPGATVLVAAAIYARASGTRLAALDAEG